MNAEGWYQDPFRLHEARWISDGTPTALVRDGGAESQDPPPSATFDGQLEPVAEDAPADGEDLRRADDEEAATPSSIRTPPSARSGTPSARAAGTDHWSPRHRRPAGEQPSRT